MEYLNINEEEFNEIVLRHLIPPAKPINPKTLLEGNKLWDQDLWFREDK